MTTHKTILALSGGKDSFACLHLLRPQLDSAIYVDTGFAYPETLALIDYAETLLPVHRVYAPRAEQHQRRGIPSDVVPIEWAVDTQALQQEPKPFLIQSSFLCCYENLAVPLFQKAAELGATHVVFGQRHAEPLRSAAMNGTVVHGITRVHPIEDWSTDRVLQFLAQHMPIPDHFRLVTHSSLDCYDCTGFARFSRDRVAWTKERYPAYYQQYAARHDLILHALDVSL